MICKDEKGEAWVSQYVMAYRAPQQRLHELLPMGYRSLRPVLRINAEALQKVPWLGGRSFHRVECNTPVEHGGVKGWLNLVTLEDDADAVLLSQSREGIHKVRADIAMDIHKPHMRLVAAFHGTPFLQMHFTDTGREGGCPKEADNQGTFYCGSNAWKPVEAIGEKKRYCECAFAWSLPPASDMPAGLSMLEAVCSMEPEEILGAYAVAFARKG